MVVYIWKGPKDTDDEVIDVWYAFEIDGDKFENGKTIIEELIKNSNKIYEVIVKIDKSNIVKDNEEWKVVDKEYTFEVFKNWLNVCVKNNDIDIIVYDGYLNT